MKDIPINLEECFIALSKMSSKEDIEKFKNKSEDGVTAQLHHSVGMGLRNKWGLWGGSQLKTFFEELGLWHADDMSSVILTSYHRHLNKIDLNLDKQVEHYKSYWKKMGIARIGKKL